jgi:outer membrane receptor protein involved in Fe transport
MKISMYRLAAFMLLILPSFAAFTQNIISGTIRNSTDKQTLPAISVILKGTSLGTYTDERGNFKLSTTQNPPYTLIVSSVGFASQEVQVTNPRDVQISMVPATELGVEVVVSASRVPERILESPVSIERVSSSTIRTSPATTYYDLLKNIKGVDLTYSSLTYATPSTRGFNGSGNARFNQLVDGMDNQAPGLNFAVGSVIGLTELDVESMELLPGASSALYGSGGMNGTLLINSKDPFKYQGLSFQIKQGMMHTDSRQRSGPTPYYDWTVRWGKKVSDRFAFKIGAQLIQAKDWIADDETNYLAGNAAFNTYGGVKPGDRVSDPNYDGVNVYGDETNSSISDLFKMTTLNTPVGPVPARAFIAGLAKQNYAQNPLSPAVSPAQFAAMVDQFLSNNNGIDTTKPLLVSRTGYTEKQVLNNNTVNLKLSGGAYYMLTDKIEASLVGYWGTGTTVYTGSDRYSLKDLKMGQYKLELRHPNWFVRLWTTQENAGESFNATITTRLFNEQWKSSQIWYPTYAVGYLTGKVLGLDDVNAHNGARQASDVGRPAAGSDQFNQIFDKVRTTPIKDGGGLFLDRSDLYMGEVQYNCKDQIKIVDLVVGASWKQYVLNSQGTLFADTAGNIHINEYGVYAQASKNLFDERVRLSVAGRYDKNENFEGRFTPRITAVFRIAPEHNIRASYQTAYRFPTTQNQWINLVVGGGTFLIGGLPDFRTFYHFDSRPVYSVPNVRDAAIAGNPGLLQPVQFGEYKPETAKSFELGYKGVVNKRLLIDVYGYYSRYDNFLGRRIVVRSKDGTIGSLLGGLRNTNLWETFSVAVNSIGRVTVKGFGASLDYLLPKNFGINVNFSSDKISDVETGFVAFFNAPGYRLNVGLSNSGFGYQKRFAFNAILRNQNGFFFESDFRQGEVSGYTSVDAQVSYKFPKIKSLVRLGGSNIFNTYYKTAFGNPEIGGIYYVAFAYNVF